MNKFNVGDELVYNFRTVVVESILPKGYYAWYYKDPTQFDCQVYYCSHERHLSKPTKPKHRVRRDAYKNLMDAARTR